MPKPERILRRAGRIAAVPVVLLVFVACALYLLDALTGVNSPYQPQLEPLAAYPELGAEWRMHKIDNPGDWLPNGLDAWDVNGDGQQDYLTNYEFRGRIRVVIHPGVGNLQLGWHALDVGWFPNAESAAFADLDGDRTVDIVVAHGVEHTRIPPGIHVSWGSGDASSPHWQPGGDLPASAGGWHFLYIKTCDLDGDGDFDIVAGGRSNRVAGSSRTNELLWAGIRWFQNPGAHLARDLSAWQIHTIDPFTKSGHGFTLGDLDGDGDTDLANGNADWDTPDSEEALTWYENPGSAVALTQPWQAHQVYRGTEFYGKEQVAIADLDRDGYTDLLTQVEKEIYWLRGPNFNLIRIPKHPAAQWRARPILTADLDNDGNLEIIGALIHRDGILPRDRAAVFYLQWQNNAWQTKVIKWGDAFLGLGAFNGEKWDQFLAADVDGDGDLDLVANCEEYNRLRAIISVVWFENPR